MKWTSKQVEERFREAVQTLKRMPPETLQGYVSSWPPILRDVVEMMQMDPPKMRLGPPLPEQIDEMNTVILKWIVWVEEDERRLIWMRAEKVRWKTICWRMGVCRATAHNRYHLALSKIAIKLSD